MPSKIPLVDLAAQYAALREEVEVAIRGVLERNDFILGAAVAEFETAFAAYVGAAHGVGVASGTDALILALRALGLGPGDEIIVPAMTFVATASAVAACGARPVFVDVRPGDLLMDPATVEAAVGPRTRALLPVHLYGLAADMDALGAIAQRHGLWLVEDAAQAHGATWRGRRVGTFGAAGCFSFYPGKNLGAYGDAGMVLTMDAQFADRVRLLRDHGSRTKYEHVLLGYCSRLDTLQAAILSAKLRHLDEWNGRRAVAAARYDALIGARLERIGRGCRDGAVQHIYAVRVPGGQRDRVRSRLEARGIGVGVHYPVPVHRQPVFAEASGATLPVAEQAAAELLSLPLYPEITPTQQEYVVEELMGAIG
jgi:dTDP-4-amino-4,6-dideoxygalactose transaminase